MVVPRIGEILARVWATLVPNPFRHGSSFQLICLARARPSPFSHFVQFLCSPLVSRRFGMTLLSYVQQDGCVKPPKEFTNLIRPTFVELHGWLHDDTPAGGAVGVVTKIGDGAKIASIRVVKAESAFL